jgi:hypothetical protein
MKANTINWFLGFRFIVPPNGPRLIGAARTLRIIAAEGGNQRGRVRCRVELVKLGHLETQPKRQPDTPMA